MTSRRRMVNTLTLLAFQDIVPLNLTSGQAVRPLKESMSSQPITAIQRKHGAS